MSLSLNSQLNTGLHPVRLFQILNVIYPLLLEHPVCDMRDSILLGTHIVNVFVM